MTSRTTRRLRARTLCGLVAATLLALLAAVPASGAARAEDAPRAGAVADEDLQTFGIGPANKDGLDRRQAFVYAGRPGTVIRDQVALLNYTFKPQKVRVYAADAFTADGGAFDVLPAAEKSVDLGAWTNLKPRVVTLPARSTEPNAAPSQIVIPFRIKVPAKATPGDHAAGIIASTRTDDVVDGATAGIVVDRRVGARIYLRVAGSLDPKLEIQDLSVTYDGTLNPIGSGSARVSYRVVNTGNVALSGKQSVTVSGPFGLLPTTSSPQDVTQILPGDDVLVETTLDGAWPLVRLTADVVLEPYAGDPESPETFPSVSASASTWAIPWTLLALIILVLALTWAERQRRRRQLSAAPDDLSSLDEEVALR